MFYNATPADSSNRIKNDQFLIFVSLQNTVVLCLSDDRELAVRVPLFGFRFKTSHQVVLKEGDSIIIKFWSWRKMGYIQKLVTRIDGKIRVEIL